MDKDFEIRIGPTIVDDSTPFRRDLLKLADGQPEISVYDTLQIARKYLPRVRFHVAEGVSPYEIRKAVVALLRQRIEPESWTSLGSHYRISIPENCNHVVLAHGFGSGDAWHIFFKETRKTPMKVRDFVDAKVPAGEQAFCVVCKDGQPESFSRLTGECLVSRGNERFRS